ncbi:hypothetical protein [Marimonas arenosa]|uniref:Secreted protein n=1 Tax=Marimonas arenosa TaxID=1795305 RepID=A0AAE3WF97_9RHOB|nr:hypothetical protein [Marimonas arenosa]MDQ2090568.1 hypothetical protein [Marimonas arenosa]
MTKPSFNLKHAAMITLFLATLPDTAQAERVVVRSGEHDDFSRLTLALPRALPWALDSDGTKARLSLSNINADFDLSGAFRRLSAGRITDLAPGTGESTLAISMSCACEIEVSRYGADLLVVDIRGTPGSVPAPDSQPEPKAETRANAGTVIPPDPVAPAAIASRHLFPFEPARTSAEMPLTFGPMIATASAEHRSSTRDSEPETGSTLETGSDTDPLTRMKRLSEAEQRLAEQLSRAVSQGLVNPKDPRLPDIPERTAETAHQRHPPAADHSAPATPPATPGLNLRAQTSADRDFSVLLAALPQTGNGETCLTDADLDITAWAGDAPFGEQVGRLRGALVGEFDRPNPEAARKLVKLYIHYGFGAEALQVLRVSALTGDGTMVLKSMAEIMEFGHATGPGPLSNQVDCDSHAALWAVLSHADLPEEARPNGAAILRAINTLPPQIRGLVGPMASERLLAAHFEDLAAQVLAIVARGQDTPDPRFNMADARVQLAEGDIDAAGAALDGVVASNTDQAPRALITLIDTRLDAGLPVDIQTAALAGAYAQEYRSDPLGAELKRAHVLALAEAGDYDTAFRELALFTAAHEPGESRNVRSHVMAALAGDAGDVSFLKHALDPSVADRLDLSIASANGVARRLIDLGFAAEASAFLLADAEGAEGRKRQLLRARAALLLEEPRRAEAALFGLTGPDADLLRAEARAMIGDHDSARQLFADLGRQDDMVAEAWLGAHWDTLRDADDPLWQEAARMATTPAPEAAADTPGVLAKNRTLIEESVAARATMSDLLTRLSLDAAPPAEE